MSATLTLEEFYTNFLTVGGTTRECIIHPQTGHFNVFERGGFCKHLTQIHRADFYKISLVIGTGILHLEDRKVEVNGPALIFFNPEVPHLWESVSPKQAGYFCLFNHQFMDQVMGDNFASSPLCNAGMETVYQLSSVQGNDLLFIFRRMMDEVESDYVKKYEVLQHYLNLILHEANKLEPVNAMANRYINASSRISAQFIQLLERQFPVDSTEHSLKLKTPGDFAERLSVHVNHLNRAVKDVTGHSTSDIISARITKEAEALLRHTNNSVAEIAYSLGFEHPSNFNAFFKKQTLITPKVARTAKMNPVTV
ncbi:MAG: AraC family transcriptional regulator [Bacteroidota bacterium]